MTRNRKFQSSRSHFTRGFTDSEQVSWDAV